MKKRMYLAKVCEHANLLRQLLMQDVGWHSKVAKYQPAAIVDDQDNNQQSSQQVPTSCGHSATLNPRDTTPSAASLFDDETTANLDDLNTYNIEELTEIACNCEAEEAESDDQAFTDLGELELTAQLEAEVCC